MNAVKRIAGILWIAVGIVTLFYLIKTAAAEIARNPVSSTKLQWGIFIVIFIPIAVGLMLFGYYALKGEYGTQRDK
jgi:Ni,Fe-hydrogenase I cytochrome b subunit